MFTTLHRVLKTTDILKKVTTSVIEEFAQDGVVYLELRTTLRALPTTDAYVNAVIEGLMSAPSVLNGKIDARLLLSIDRARGLTHATETVELLLASHKLWPNLILGVDISGNPSVGTLLQFVPLLHRVRSAGLRTSVHFAEVPNETDQWLAFLHQHMPDRIGHGTFLPRPDQSHLKPVQQQILDLIRQARVPIEMCLTSNVLCRTVPDYSSHHVSAWIEANQPVCICTDDKGVFRCSSSGEMEILVKLCGVQRKQVRTVLLHSIQAAFCSDMTKSQLVNRIEAFFQ